MEVNISVRGLVEFILRSGDIDNRTGGGSDEAMAEGSRIHRMLQKRAGADYRAEVPLSFSYVADDLTINVDGRADGIIENETGVTVDEIKCTYADVMRFKEAKPLHVAQASFYAFIIAKERELKEVKVRITYCNIDTEEVRYFNLKYTYDELLDFTNKVLTEYEKWARMSVEWIALRNESIKGLPFPYEYRKGQDELVKNVYLTICHKKKLFLEAPTGVGKTLATLYPGICAMGQNKTSNIFYLTAKTITRTVASEGVKLLRTQGLKAKTVILTAKEKICATGEKECNPDSCPYAKGHFDRINEALFAILTECEDYSREKIEEYAEKYQVCPFELSLDISLFSDIIICDYNYAFDPRAKLKRFFADERKGNYLFLIDEAHNLVDRARTMFSAELFKEDFLKIKRITQEILPKISKRAESCNKALLNLKRDCQTALINPEFDSFTEPLMRLYGAIEDFLDDERSKHNLNKANKGDAAATKEVVVPKEVKDDILEFYFEIAHFLSIYELLDENYTTYCTYTETGDFYIRLFCVNPAKNLEESMKKAVSTILFSATLLPINYYKKLLAGHDDDYEVYAQSVFNPAKRGLFIAGDVTTKYTRRSEEEYTKIARYIYNIVRERDGNYMVFFPSYGLLEKVNEIFVKDFSSADWEVISQEPNMKEADREAFLNRFIGNALLDISGVLNCEVVEEEDSTLIGMCVMGGIFSEGIDLKNDSLIGAIIVGTGLPQVCLEQEIIKDYFDCDGEDGFDYSYRYPGMNKVLQAAGRVIRTEEDIGVVALLDERFLQTSYKKLYPREWENKETVEVTTVSRKIQRFWDEWL